MLNEEFIDEKDKEIFRLNQTIKAFKAYDKERRAFLQKLQWELEDVSEKYSELRNSLSCDEREELAKRDELMQKMLIYKKSITQLNQKLFEARKVIELMNDDEKLARAEEIVKNYTLVQLKEENRELKKRRKQRMQSSADLVAQLVQLKRRLSTYEDV